MTFYLNTRFFVYSSSTTERSHSKLTLQYIENDQKFPIYIFLLHYSNKLFYFIVIRNYCRGILVLRRIEFLIMMKKKKYKSNAKWEKIWEDGHLFYDTLCDTFLALKIRSPPLLSNDFITHKIKKIISFFYFCLGKLQFYWGGLNLFLWEFCNFLNSNRKKRGKK